MKTKEEILEEITNLQDLMSECVKFKEENYLIDLQINIAKCEALLWVLSD